MTSTASAPRAVDRLLGRAPAERLGVLRVLVGGYAVVSLAARLLELLRLTGRDPARFEPVGILSWLDAPLAPSTWHLVLVAAFASGIAFTAGWRFRLTGPAFAVLFMVVTTYRDLWGQLFHTDNLVALHVAILGFVRAADAWSLDARAARAGATAGRTPPAAGYAWPARTMAVVLAVTYVIAGVSKLRLGGTAWLWGDSLRNQVAFDNLRKIAVGHISSPLGEWLVSHAWLFVPMAWLTIVVELAAPVVLAGGRWRTAWVLAAWTFHAGIVVLMAVVFAYPLSGIAFACLYRVERLPAWVAASSARIGDRVRRSTPGPPR